MSVMDNEGHDPQGLFNTPSTKDAEIDRLMDVAAKAIANNVTLRAALQSARDQVDRNSYGRTAALHIIDAALDM